ncbi:MAG: VanW family protein [Thermoleophilia bacterium]
MQMSVLVAAPLRRRSRAPLYLAFALAILVAAAAAAFVARAHLYRGEALPGVRVLGADVGGRDRASAARAIADVATPRLLAPVRVVAAGHTLKLMPAQVLRLDARATAGQALASGRAFPDRALALLSPAPPARNVEPVLRLRQPAAARLVRKLTAYARSPRSATVALTDAGLVVKPARVGTRVDTAALFAALRSHVATGHSTIRVRYVRAPPAIGNAQATEAATTARALVAEAVTMRFRGATVTTLEPARLTRLLVFRPAGHRYVVTFDAQRSGNVLRRFVDPWRKRAKNAQFDTSGPVVRVIPSRDGIDIDDQAVADALAAAAYSSVDRTADLSLHARPAELTTEEAQALGIRRRLTTFTTDMGPSSSNRIHNVHLMADFIDGTIIRSGEVFSFNDVVGPRTAERGFLEGQMIVGGLVLPAIGGGVCQTATTLFNNAFEAGLPILERHNHNLYLSHYPLGRDATVSWGGPDFKFGNDLKHAILIKTSYTNSTLTFSFYGTPQGRRVVASTGPETNFKSPTTSYAVDPTAPHGSVRVESGSGRSGFDVTVERTVYERGRLLRRGTFTSRYIPEGPTYIYGPGRTPPGPYFVLPSSP